MNIRKTIITATVALTMVAMIAPGLASADIISDLQAQINSLMAQLQALQGSTTTTTTTGSVPAACVGVTFTRNLIVGSTGQDVKCMQTLMNAHGYQLAVSGAGSPGNETMYFGPLTLAKVRALQAAQGWTPASQVGPLSRALLNSWLAGGSTTTTTTTTSTVPGCTSTSGYSPTTGQPCSSSTATTTPPQTGAINAMLSASNPPSANIVGGQATADLSHFTFTGSGLVTSVMLTRSGFSDQSTLTNIYLYDGNIRITDGYSFNATSTLTMNGLSIAVSGMKEISVRGDVKAAASSDSGSLAVALTGFTANGVTSSVNVKANEMYIVSGNLATASVGTNTVAEANVNAGSAAYTFWSAPLQVNVRAVWLKGANFRMIGSVPSDALSNIKLFIDGIDTGKVATVMMIQGSNYAVFDLISAPISLMTGSHTVDMRADIQKGSNRNVQVSIQQAADFTLTDPQNGVNIAVTTTGSTSYTANSGGSISILTGSATVANDPVFNAMTNIAGGTANAVIAKYKVHAYGEDVKVNSLVVTPTLDMTAGANGVVTATATSNATGTTATMVLNGLGYTAAPVVTVSGGTCGTLPTATATLTSGTVSAITLTGAVTCTVAPTLAVAAPSTAVVGGLNNVTLYFNGSQVGSQQTWPVAQGSLTYQLSSQLIAPAGVDSWLEVRADLQTTTNVSYTAGLVGANLALGSSNGQGQVSLATLNFPTAAITGHTLTIQTGLLVVSTNTGYLSQSIPPNTANIKIGSFVAQNQSTSESVRLTSLTVAIGGTTAITNLSALRTSLTSGSGSTPIQPTATNTFSVNETLAPGASKTIDIFADSSTETGVTAIVTLTVASIGATSNVSSAGTATTGQTITFSTGTLATPTFVTSSSTTARFVAAGTDVNTDVSGATDATKATYSFISAGGNAVITELKFTVTGTNTVTNVCVGDKCASPVSGVAFLTNLNLAVQNGGGGKTQEVSISYSKVGTGGIVSATTSAVALTHVKYTSGGTTTTITPTVTAPTMIMVGSKPVVVVNTTSNAGLVLTQENKIGEVTITADAKGNIKMNDLVFGVGSSNIETFAVASPRIADGNTTIPGTGCGANTTTTSIIYCEFGTTGNVFDTTGGGGVEINTDFDGYQIAAGISKTFSLFGTVTGTATASTTTRTVSTSLLNNAANAFNWDDTASAVFASDGAVASTTDGTNQTGVSIYNFPTGSYSIHD